MVTPPALIAAIPVGASTIIRFGLSALSFRRKVVLPVPALAGQKKMSACVFNELPCKRYFGYYSPFDMFIIQPIRSLSE